MKSKYDYNLAEKMWKEHMRGQTLEELQKKYGISDSVISQYLTRYMHERKGILSTI